MNKPEKLADEGDVDGMIYPDMPNFAATDDEFIALVEAGIVSYEAGPTFDLGTVAAEIRDMLKAGG